MKITTLGLVFPALLMLSACDDSPQQILITPDEQQQINAQADASAKADTLQRLSKDQEEAKLFLKQIQEKDPKFVDAYYRLNDRGNKEMVLVKDLGDGNMVEFPAFEAGVGGNAVTTSTVASTPTGTPQVQQSATDGGGSIMPALVGGMLAGAVMGHLASNAMQGTVRPRMQQEEEKRRATSSYGGAVASQSSNNARMAATRSAQIRAAAASSGSRAAAPAAGGTTAKSGAFGGGGARAGGYSGGASASGG